MKRITKDMVERGGWRYCCVCRQLGPRVKAHWQHEGREYCDTHKPAPNTVHNIGTNVTSKQGTEYESQ